MSQYLFITVIAIVILLGGGIATVMVGLSSKNKEGNPDYDKKTKSIFTRLSLYYVIPIVLVTIAFIVYLFN